MKSNVIIIKAIFFANKLKNAVSRLRKLKSKMKI